MLKYLLFNFLFSFISVLYAYDAQTLYRDNTAAYITKVSRSIASQLDSSKNASEIKKYTITITPMVQSSDFKTSLPITNRIDENLIYELSQKGFLMIDANAMKILGASAIESKYILVSSYTNYKYEMVINSRIVERKTGLVCASAQVSVPRKTLKAVDKLYNKNSWFTPQEK
jgi:TolB-like protein